MSSVIYFCDAKDAELNSLGNLAARSHFGPKQFCHDPYESQMPFKPVRVGASALSHVPAYIGWCLLISSVRSVSAPKFAGQRGQTSVTRYGKSLHAPCRPVLRDCYWLYHVC